MHSNPNPKDEEAKHSVEILKHLSLTHRSEFQCRKGWEWKLFLTVTTSFALVTIGLLSKEAGFREGLSSLGIWTTSFLFVAITCGLLWCLHRSHNTNKTAAETVEQQLLDLYNRIPNQKVFELFPLPPDPPLQDRSRGLRKKLRAWEGWLWECAVVAFVGMVCAFLISNKHHTATQRLPACPKCSEVMESGFLVGHSNAEAPKSSTWISFNPDSTQLSKDKNTTRPAGEIRGFRCKGCGYLEIYVN